MRAVPNGIAPNKPQGEWGPTKTSEMMPRPTSPLMILSIDPMFFFIALPPQETFFLLEDYQRTSPHVCDKVTKAREVIA